MNENHTFKSIFCFSANGERAMAETRCQCKDPEFFWREVRRVGVFDQWGKEPPAPIHPLGAMDGEQVIFLSEARRHVYREHMAPCQEGSRFRFSTFDLLAWLPTFLREARFEATLSDWDGKAQNPHRRFLLHYHPKFYVGKSSGRPTGALRMVVEEGEPYYKLITMFPIYCPCSFCKMLPF